MSMTDGGTLAIFGSSAEEISNNLKQLGTMSKGASDIVKGMGESTMGRNLQRQQQQQRVAAMLAQMTGRAEPPPVPKDPAAARRVLTSFGIPTG